MFEEVTQETAELHLNTSAFTKCKLFTSQNNMYTRRLETFCIK